MDIVFILLLGLALIAVVITLIKLITSKWLKEKLSAFLSKRNIKSAVVIRRAEFESMLVEAAKNAPRTKLKDLEKALAAMDDIDVILCSTDVKGEIQDIEKIKGEQGIDIPLDILLDEHEGMLIFE